MNKITIIGNLTRDPESRVTSNGVNVTSVSVAVNRRGKAEGTDFFRVTCWRGLADIASRYLSKGSKVCVIGQVTLGSYKDREGEMHHSMDITADELELLTPRAAGAEPVAAPVAAPMPVEKPDDLPF